MMKTRLFAPSAFLAAAALLTPFAAANDNNSLQIFINPNAGGGTGQFTQNITHPGPIDSSGSATGGANSSGDASVHVDYGIIRLTGDASGTLNTVCAATIRDGVTITAPGIPTGTLGTLTYSLQVTGTLSTGASGGAAAGWQLQSDLDGGSADINKSATFYGPDAPNPGYTGDPFGVYSATITFQYGGPLPLNITLTASAQAAFDSHGPGTAEFNGPVTLNWLGMQNVTANGSPVTNFTVSSESGTDWRHAIPVSTCGSADFNGDGDTGTDADIEAFFACLAGNCCATCGSADFNGDGDVGTDADIEAFFRVLAGGSC